MSAMESSEGLYKSSCFSGVVSGDGIAGIPLIGLKLTAAGAFFGVDVQAAAGSGMQASRSAWDVL